MLQVVWHIVCVRLQHITRFIRRLKLNSLSYPNSLLYIHAQQIEAFTEYAYDDFNGQNTACIYLNKSAHVKWNNAGADPENLKGGGPGKSFDNLPRKSANFMHLRSIPKIFKRWQKKGVGGS